MPVARECPSSTTLRIVDYASGNFSTDRRFTGQREEASRGCYDYGARLYAPALGRFLQADTLVPELLAS